MTPTPPSDVKFGCSLAGWSPRAVPILVAALIYSAYAATLYSRCSPSYALDGPPNNNGGPYSTDVEVAARRDEIDPPPPRLENRTGEKNEDEMKRYIAELEATVLRLGGPELLTTLREGGKVDFTSSPSLARTTASPSTAKEECASSRGQSLKLEQCLDEYDHTAHLLYDAMSERGFEEYDCVEPPIVSIAFNNTSDEEHLDRVEAWKPLFEAKLRLTSDSPLCGCIHSARRRRRRLGAYANCTLSELDNETNKLRLNATTESGNREDDAIWIVFVGDSTIRQHVHAVYKVARLHRNSTIHCERPQFPSSLKPNFNSTRWRAGRYFNDEGKKEGRFFAKPYESMHEYLRSPPYLLRLGNSIGEESINRFLHGGFDNEMKGDFDVICTLKPAFDDTRKRGGVNLILSFRSNYGFTASYGISILRRPHTHRIIPTNTPRDETRTYYRRSLYPALDEPYFVEVPWVLGRALGDEAVRRLETRGCDLMVATHAIWADTAGPYGAVEKRRCGFPLDSRDTSGVLSARRLSDFMGEACSLYGRKRFVWRTSNTLVTGKRTHVRRRNEEARATAMRNGITLMDYEKLHAAHGSALKDGIHTTDDVALDGVVQMIYYLMRTRRDVYSERQMHTLEEVVRSLTDPRVAPASVTAAIKKRRMNATGEDDGGVRERAGLEVWSVRESLG